MLEERQSCCKVAKDWAELCSSVVRKGGPVSDELGYLAEEISKQHVEDVVCFPLTAYSKMQKKR